MIQKTVQIGDYAATDKCEPKQHRAIHRNTDSGQRIGLAGIYKLLTTR
jgi:hypothetical protein